MISLRDYQTSLIDELRNQFRSTKSVLVVLPTGGGKTAIATFILSGILRNRQRGWFICHRAELIQQTSLTLNRFGVRHSFIAAGMEYDKTATIHIVSIDTLKARIADVEFPEYAIWDEAHHLVAPTWLSVKENMSSTRHVGLTATPELLDGSGLGVAFSRLILGPTAKQLIACGHLSGFDFYGPAMPDLTQVKTEQGDYSRSGAASVMSKPAIVGDVVKNWIEKAEGRITIGFAPNRVTSQLMAQRFNEAGIPSMHIDGSSPKAERASAAKKLASGEIKVLWNVELLGEGYDLSAQAGTDVTIDCMIDASPTKSLARFLQRCGRPLRPKANGSKAVIIDCAGNWTRHGLPNTERQWSLDAKKRSTRGDNDNVPIRQCMQCYYVHEPAPVCPACGHRHEIRERPVKEDTSAELKLIEAAAHEHRMQELNTRVRMCKTLDDFKTLAADMGYSPGWAWHRYSARKGKKAG
jgi:superfamily II DNA or RNA helicase